MNEDQISNVLETLGDGNDSEIEEFADLDCDDPQFDPSFFERMDDGCDEDDDEADKEGIPDSTIEMEPRSNSSPVFSVRPSAKVTRTSTNKKRPTSASLREESRPGPSSPSGPPSVARSRSSGPKSTRSTNAVAAQPGPSSSSSSRRKSSSRLVSIQLRQSRNVAVADVSAQESSPAASPRSEPQSSRPDTWKAVSFQDKPHDYEDAPVRPVRDPMDYYMEYFDDQFFEHVSVCTNNYFLRKTGRELKTNKTEIMKLIGVHVIMGCIPYPRLPMYWRSGFSLGKIADTMSRDRFIQLRNALHVVDSDTQPPDETQNSLWKVQPMIDQVRQGCQKQERVPGYFSLDEQMIPFTGRCALRQVVKNKPRPVGLKNFVLTTSGGLMLDFEIYKGAKTMFEETSLGLGPSVVLHLTRSIPPGSCLYHDRYFTTIPLVDELDNRNIHSTGTIMVNRVPERANLKFKKDTEMARGESQHMVRKSAVIVKWKDSKSVLMASNCTGNSTNDAVKRWDKKTRKYVDIPAPKVIQNYNKHMGGVDVLDQQMEYYRTFIKTNKWTLKVLIHFCDLALVNSWRAYKIDCQANNLPRKNTMDLLDFRLEIGDVLTKTPDKRRRESGDDDILEVVAPKKHRKAIKPATTLRYDGYDHLPMSDDLKSPRFCQNETCKSRTKIRCIKCNTYLCIARNQNCFKDYHTK